MKFKQVLFLLLISLLLPVPNSWARWVWSPNEGKFVNAEGETHDQAEEMLQYAIQFQREKDPKEAISQLKSVVEKYPSSRVAPDAQYRIGVVYEEMGDYKKAFEAYKKLITTYPQNRSYDEVVERLFKIGNAFLSGKKGRVLGLDILPSLPQAIQVFQFIVDQAPFSQYGADATFQLGLAQKQAGKFDDAVQTFQNLIDQHAQSEKVADARFQLAETSYLKSKSQYRDQRALDQASEEVGKFIQQYPDASVTEEASRLKQSIDEKNAEKNYRIGLYYEKENYLQSALIYYTDAAERYPQTAWGLKAKDRIEALKEPSAYQSQKEQQMGEELQILEAKLKVVPPEEAVQKERLQRKIELLEKRKKMLEKSKKENLTRIGQDLDRRRHELSEKWKNLEKKKKLNAKNTSPDFKSAMDRWEASLKGEEEQLANEKHQLQSWREDLGVRDRKLGLNLLPFMPEEATELEKVRALDAKKLFKLSQERKDLLDEKEILYKQRGEVMTRVDQVLAESPEVSDEWMKDLDLANAEVKSKKEMLESLETKVRSKDLELIGAEREFEKRFGSAGMASLYKAPAEAVAASAEAVTKTLDKSFDLLNPFGGEGSLENKTLQELLERQMHMKEKSVAQQNLVDTLSQAFNAELAMKEQKQLAKKLESAGPITDPADLRKETKGVQKALRALYQDVEDLDKEKSKLLDQLESEGRQYRERTPMTKVGNQIAHPFIGTAKLMKAFVVGLPNHEVEITKSADKLPEASENFARAKQLQKEIETKSLLIEAKSREIVQTQKRLDILKAQASLESGVKFRSVFVEVPYEFIGEAIENARKIVPKKNREAFLMNQLQEETAKLESLKKDIGSLSDLIARKEKGPASAAESPAGETSKPETASKPALQEMAVLESKINGLRSELDKLKEEKNAVKQVLRAAAKSASSQENKAAVSVKQDRKSQRRREKEAQELRSELREIEEHLKEMIQKESKLQGEETTILQKRISAIEQAMPGVASKSLTQDLVQEKEGLKDRLSQLGLRKDFLDKEWHRFQPAETGKTKS